ncbi:twin-arginine translocation signal domain-containing protein [Natrarchaeobius chitinivorans]|uniref:Calcium-binding protein n=1 Tax=Natrarchaeobius chitinivorans TaxID=1679083 RepID=A0A3N6MKY2_NATCH|nr:twin-arginine translocation signal domain-containing protein [Natrarchaeobius chitinivorans]RQG96631.1 calcium-binding protein [Natrarchaeobius chitinivorans]
MTENIRDQAGDSRRTFMKKGGLAAAALTVGTGATVTIATAVNGVVAVLHGSDYYPGADFDILTQFGTRTRNNFLQQYDEDEAEFDDPGDWEVFVIRIDIGEGEGELGHLLIDTDDDDPDVEAGDSGSMDDIASFRNPERNLIETEVDL